MGEMKWKAGSGRRVEENRKGSLCLVARAKVLSGRQRVDQM